MTTYKTTLCVIPGQTITNVYFSNLNLPQPHCWCEFFLLSSDNNMSWWRCVCFVDAYYLISSRPIVKLQHAADQRTYRLPLANVGFCLGLYMLCSIVTTSGGIYNGTLVGLRTHNKVKYFLSPSSSLFFKSLNYTSVYMCVCLCEVVACDEWQHFNATIPLNRTCQFVVVVPLNRQVNLAANAKPSSFLRTTNDWKQSECQISKHTRSRKSVEL